MNYKAFLKRLTNNLELQKNPEELTSDIKVFFGQAKLFSHVFRVAVASSIQIYKLWTEQKIDFTFHIDREPLFRQLIASVIIS
jgi:hypothetical protein